MELGIVRQVDIENEMKAAYLDYAMSVITSRALPDVRDGLKPVQRRILYAMDDMGLQPDKAYKKSARIVGEVLGKYHPHGDSAVYDAMARMAQPFTMRYLLVDGQGNFGSVDGDNPAAMRYTEARLTPVARELLADLDKDTVDFVDNFDGTLSEPSVLPAKLPNLLVNGASGIAVGMATNVPPHNLAETCDAAIYVIEHFRDTDSISVDDLMRVMPGPDFPTGGTILGTDGIRAAYATGNGQIVVRAKAHFEDAGGGRSRIVVTELPYQVSKAGLIEKIAELVRDKRIDTISDLRDESDRQGMRMVIELKRGLAPQPTLAQLFKHTAMQSNFNVNLLALVAGEPRVLSLKRALQLFVEHRQEVITRRTRYELERAKLRAHILEGLIIALDNLDEVIDTIRRSQTAETAHHNLVRKFKLSDQQAQAILELQLRRLAALERRKIEEEYAELQKRIKYLEDLLRSPRKILQLVKTELEELKTRHGDARRTRIVSKEADDIRAEDLLPDQDVYLALTRRGHLSRLPRPEAPLTAQGKDAALQVVASNTVHSLVLHTNRGRFFTLPVHQIPEAPVTGTPLAGLVTLEADELITGMVDIPDFAQSGYLTMCTKQGRIKRTAVAEFAAIRSGGMSAISLDPNDGLLWTLLTDGHQQIILVTDGGRALRFGEEDVRAMGRSAAGVIAIKLSPPEQLIYMGLVEEGASLLVASAKGYAKRTPVSEYPLQSRSGRGVATYAKATPQTGPLVAATVVADADTLAFVCATGNAEVREARSIQTQGRSTRGTPVLRLLDKDSIIAVSRLALPHEGRSSPDTPAQSSRNTPSTKEKKAKSTAARVPVKSTGPASAVAGKAKPRPTAKKATSAKPPTAEKPAANSKKGKGAGTEKSANRPPSGGAKAKQR